MFIYNITNKVNTSIANEWLNWQKDEHIPEIMATGLFNEFKILQLLDQDDTDGVTYIIQFYTAIKKNYENYISNKAPILREKAFKKWGDKFISFRSLMKPVQ